MMGFLFCVFLDWWMWLGGFGGLLGAHLGRNWCWVFNKYQFCSLTLSALCSGQPLKASVLSLPCIPDRARLLSWTAREGGGSHSSRL